MTDWLLTASERPMAGPFFQNFRKVRKEKMPMQKIPFVTKEKLDEIISRYPTSFYIYDEKGEGELSLAAIGVCARNSHFCICLYGRHWRFHYYEHEKREGAAIVSAVRSYTDMVCHRTNISWKYPLWRV